MAISAIGGENQSTWRKPPTCRKSLTNKCYIEYTPAEGDSNSQLLLVKGTDCIGSYKSSYHTITTTMAPE